MVQTRGQTLRAMRNHAGLSQRELAERVGVSAQAVSAWENDDNAPSPANLLGLDDVLRSDGAVMALYGYVVPTEDELIARLTATIDRLAGELQELRDAFEQHQAESHRHRDP